MRLTDLNPGFVGHGGPGILTKDRQPIPFRHGVGIIFDCPCGCDQPCYVDFKNPMDGGPTVGERGPFWQRTGETFETLSLAPSILRAKAKGGCGWHGFIRDGEVISV